MSGPWESYQNVEAGPWTQYADVPAQAPPRPVGAAMSVNNPPRIEDAPQVGPALSTAQTPSPGRSWLDVPGEALSNLPSSAGNFVNALVHPFIHPVDTGEAIYSVGKGVASKLMPVEPGQEASAGYKRQRKPLNRTASTPEQIERRAQTEAPADAVGEFFADRYGSVEGIKNTLATDPVGVMADASAVLTGGATLPVRGANVVGKLGAILDPVTQAGNVLKLGAKGVEKGVSNALGMTTGAGPESVRAAGRAGREGGEAAKAFTENMRGNVPIENIVDLAKSGLEKIRQERAAAYKAGKADLSKDKTVLDFNDIDAKVGKASEVGTYKGQTTEPKAVAITQEMTDSIGAWKQLDPAEFHTPEGLDALKRRLGNIRDSTQYGSPERVAADRIYKAVRDEVAAQAPGYSKMMEDYARASDKIKEVTKTFSLSEKATGDTAARKLQSATRDGAQTSWRKRGELLDELATHEPTLPYAIAGQATNALMPRGLVARGGGMLAAGSAGTGLAVNPMAALPIAAFSPRVVGETVYMLGKAVGTVDTVANALRIDAGTLRSMGQGSFQAGRMDDVRSRALALRDVNALR